MGFYGNITNASRTQFSFDKIYPNKYEMFSNASIDGVYVGRYVLVEYDLDTGADAYASNLYKYGEDLYLATEEEYFQGYGVTSQRSLLKQPLSQNKVVAGTLINGNLPKNGTIVRIMPQHNFIDLNDSHMYVRVTNVMFDQEHQTGTFTYEGVTDDYYWSYINAKYGEDLEYSLLIDFTEYDFEPGFYYIKNTTTNKFEIADEYDPDENYYTIGNGAKLYLYGEEEGFFYWSIIINEGYSVPQNGDIYLIRKGCSYKLNKDEELWSAAITTSDDGLSFILSWNKIVADSNSNYYKNFNIDKSSYPQAGRGYDSTVWQKVYASGEQYYIMIAELNTIVPNFAVTAEAPTMLPFKPHFDADSTNMYYNLHIQPQWGFRIKAANAGLLGDS